VDIDPRKIGRRARGVPIVSPEALRAGEDTVVVAVGTRGARALVRAHLVERGFVEGRDFVCAA
jgi:mRNA-degrading endonuclease toxin of MazEF toxin-antitoxin module